jgi:hypothetical protein
MVLVKNMLCSKLHYQNGFNLIILSFEIHPAWAMQVRFRAKRDHLKDFYLKARAVIWPWLSCVCHVRSIEPRSTRRCGACRSLFFSLVRPLSLYLFLSLFLFLSLSLSPPPSLSNSLSLSPSPSPSPSLSHFPLCLRSQQESAAAKEIPRTWATGAPRPPPLGPP